MSLVKYNHTGSLTGVPRHGVSILNILKIAILILEQIRHGFLLEIFL